ncbi:MAG: hypothetical protein JWM62_1872 [Frankiales bacterium]|nr:hypothetical protein [Frankiales bacterium]
MQTVPSMPAPRHPLDVAVLVRRTHDLLAAGIPLTLLLDLGDEAGPRSHLRYTAERADAAWVPRQH